MKKSFIIALFFACILVGCSNLKDQSPKNDVFAKAFTQKEKWWLPIKDPLMDRLSNDLLKQNLDLQIAMQQVKEARALQKIATSSLFPDISIGGFARRGNAINNISTSKPESLANIGLDTSWELDLFGANRAAVRSADARFEEQQALAKDVLRIITADLMLGIVTFRQANEVLKQTELLLKTQGDQVALLKSQADAGLIDEILLDQAIAEQTQTASQIPLSKAAIKSAQYNIEVLLGKPPGSLNNLLQKYQSYELTVPSPKVTMDMPIKSVKSRPDIRAAKFNLLSSKANLEEAEANLWPKISLDQFFGAQGQSKGLKSAGGGQNPLWSFTANLTAPLINFGRLRGAIDEADAHTQQAILVYEKAILLALQDIRTALSDYLNSVNAVTEAMVTLKHRKKTVAIEQERFKAGLTDMINLTIARADLNLSTIKLIGLKANAITAYIRLQKALDIH
jgi:multidrug efflux system outer membrane protein